jgi:hypothetical protein
MNKGIPVTYFKINLFVFFLGKCRAYVCTVYMVDHYIVVSLVLLNPTTPYFCSSCRYVIFAGRFYTITSNKFRYFKGKIAIIKLKASGDQHLYVSFLEPEYT